MTTSYHSSYIRFSAAVSSMIALVASAAFAASLLSVGAAVIFADQYVPAAIFAVLVTLSAAIVAWMPSVGLLLGASIRTSAPAKASEREVAIGAAAGQIAACITLAVAVAPLVLPRVFSS